MRRDSQQPSRCFASCGQGQSSIGLTPFQARNWKGWDSHCRSQSSSSRIAVGSSARSPNLVRVVVFRCPNSFGAVFSPRRRLSAPLAPPFVNRQSQLNWRCFVQHCSLFVVTIQFQRDQDLRGSAEQLLPTFVSAAVAARGADFPLLCIPTACDSHHTRRTPQGQWLLFCPASTRRRAQPQTGRPSIPHSTHQDRCPVSLASGHPLHRHVRACQVRSGRGGWMI